MPLEIRELVIRVTVQENKRDQQQQNLDEKLQEWKARIIKECMEKIIGRLESLNER
ncbi:MAG TPA: DUF5908 family protein [Sediminibacterium sp.]|nr:DUF5908 family protein [Sediminibacterium sp.]